MTADARATSAATALRIVAAGLVVARDEIALHFPITDMVLDTLSRHELFAADSMLKRFENLQDIAQHQLFRVLLDLSAEDVASMSNIDMANKLEKFGALPSAQAWRDFARLRNRLAHAYPLDVERQVRSLNETFAAIDDLIAAVQSVVAWGRGQGFVA